MRNIEYSWKGFRCRADQSANGPRSEVAYEKLAFEIQSLATYDNRHIIVIKLPTRAYIQPHLPVIRFR